MYSISEKKRAFRAQALALRDAMDSALRRKKSFEISQALIELLKRKSPQLVAVYSSMNSEVSLEAFISFAYESGAELCFPCMMRNLNSSPQLKGKLSHMVMRKVSAQDYQDKQAPFLAKPLSIWEENDIELAYFPRIEASQLDMIVVPLVAFDTAGMRLGYGGGNYDNYLQGLSDSCIVTGVGFEEQRFDAIPHEAHDLGLPLIISR